MAVNEDPTMEQPPNSPDSPEPGDEDDSGGRPGSVPEPSQEAPSISEVRPGGPALVRLAAWFYAGLLAVALFWTFLADRSLFFADSQMGQARLDPTRDLFAGLLAAGVVILLSDRITRMTRWGEELGRELGALLGRLTLMQCIALGLMSGIAEEALFRGALQPAIGLVGASLLFGLAHFVPRRELLPWTGFTLAAGFLLGILYDATGNLLAPIVAHVVINAVNLRILTLRYGTGIGSR
jgi:membrane protease YdiL (CAAX protease family)